MPPHVAEERETETFSAIKVLYDQEGGFIGRVHVKPAHVSEVKEFSKIFPISRPRSSLY